MGTAATTNKTSVRFFCSDLDGTLLGNPEATRRFKAAWEELPRNTRPLLGYASGRLVQDVIDLLATRVLPWPDYVIGGVGTQIYDGQRKRPVNEFSQQFNSGWQLEKIESIVGAFPGVTRQPPQFLHLFKSSWYLPQATPEAIASLEKQLADAGLRVSVVYSSARDLDVLPANTTKGGALDWLCRHLSLSLENVLVAGDTSNDASMFLLPDVQGIVVENAQPELIEAVVKVPTFNATRVMADGVLEGLQHFHVIPSTPQPAASAPAPSKWIQLCACCSAKWHSAL